MGASHSQLESEPELQPQLQERQPQPQQHQQQPQQHPQQPRQQPNQQPQLQQQKQPHKEPTNKEAWLLSPQDEQKFSPKNAKVVESATVAKPNKKKGTMTPSVKRSKEQILPHNYEQILKDADSPVDTSYGEKLCNQLYAGVFLHNKTEKYWLENKSNGNCFMLYAKALSITWSEDQNYWKWVPQTEPSGTTTEVAVLKRVCWLEVIGNFDSKKLSPGIPYEVSFIVMLKDSAMGWDFPVNVKLVLPGGKKQQRQENLTEKPKLNWIEIPVGEFVPSEKDVGEMEISMYEYGAMWKQGLVVKGIAIVPKASKSLVS